MRVGRIISLHNRLHLGIQELCPCCRFHIGDCPRYLKVTTQKKNASRALWEKSNTVAWVKDSVLTRKIFVWCDDPTPIVIMKHIRTCKGLFLSWTSELCPAQRQGDDQADHRKLRNLW